MKLNCQEYRNRVLGCWMGKNIGGTLGAPFEWHRQINDVSFYTQDLGGEALPNDDLDIQLLWLIALEEKGIKIDAAMLADYWCLYVTPHWAEYGTAKINMRRGLLPPLSGTVENDFKDSCGAWIRSEIWACIAPGMPDIAANYAMQDAMLDHGDGEGTYAEVFCATLESVAFVLNDLRQCIEVGLSYIPADCGIAAAVRTAIECYESDMDWREARKVILQRHRGSVFFENLNYISQDDLDQGFHEGKCGYDAPSNIAILVYGLLYGGDDFDRMICTTVNMGEDTDCTGATAGAIFGLLHGMDAIPEKWKTPIGTKIKTACLNLGELGYFGNQVPQDIDDMTRRTTDMARQVLAGNTLGREAVTLEESPTDLGEASLETLRGKPQMLDRMYSQLKGGRFCFDFFSIDIDYGDGPFISDNQPKTIRVKIQNEYKIQANIAMHWYLPEGWTATPAADAAVLCLPGNLGKSPVMEFTLTAPQITRPMNRAVLELSIEGRPTVMNVPITLLNGNVRPL